MLNSKNISFSCFLLLLFIDCFAQETLLECTDSTFCIPSVAWMPRSKGIVINREILYDYSINSTPHNGYPIEGEGEVGINSRTEIKIRFPILLKPNLKLAIGFKYFREDYEFENLDESSYPFYKSLNAKPLKNIGTTVYMIKPFLGDKYLLIRARLNLNGDYSKDDGVSKSEFLRFSFSPMIGWKKSPYVSYAVGLAFGLDFGRYSVYPIFSYNQSFNRKWGVESLLPVNVKLRFTLSEKNIFYFKTEMKGANYKISLDDPNLDSSRLYTLQKLEIRYLLSYEREIHDWLWFGVEAGLRSNLRFDLKETARGSDTLIENKFNSAVVFKFGIFMVPPRKFFE